MTNEEKLDDIIVRLEKLERMLNGPNKDDEDYFADRNNAYKNLLNRVKEIEVANSSSFYKS